MSITLERFLPRKAEPRSLFNEGYNQHRTEASKVEIGLNRDEIIKALQKGHGQYCECDYHGEAYLVGFQADALLAAESELIIKKINHPPQGER